MFYDIVGLSYYNPYVTFSFHCPLFKILFTIVQQKHWNFVKKVLYIGVNTQILNANKQSILVSQFTSV